MPELLRFFSIGLCLWIGTLLCHFDLSIDLLWERSIPVLCALIGGAGFLGRDGEESQRIRPALLLSAVLSLLTSAAPGFAGRILDGWIGGFLCLLLRHLLLMKPQAHRVIAPGVWIFAALYCRFLILPRFIDGLEIDVLILAHLISLMSIPIYVACQYRALPTLILAISLVLVVIPATFSAYPVAVYLLPALRMEMLHLLFFIWFIRYHSFQTMRPALVCYLILSCGLPIILGLRDPIFSWAGPTLAIMVSLWFLCLPGADHAETEPGFQDFLRDRFHGSAGSA